MIAIIPAIGENQVELPIAGRSILDWVIDEAFASGVKRVIVVASREDGATEQTVASRPDLVDLAFQDKLGGLGGAIASAGIVSEDAFILLPSLLFAIPAQSILGSSSLRGCDGAILVQSICEGSVSSRMLVESNSTKVTKLLEKPHSAETDCRLAAAGRFLLSDRFLRLLHEEAAKPAQSDELDLAAVLNRGLLHQLELSIVELPAHLSAFDVSTPEGYQLAVARFGS